MDRSAEWSVAIFDRAAYRLVFLAIVLTASALVLALFLRDSGVNVYHRAGFEDMVYGRAHRPFVYRALLPTTTRVITNAIPEELRLDLQRRLAGNEQFRQLLRYLQWEPRVDVERLMIESCVAIALMYLSLVGFAYAFRYLTAGIFRAPTALVDALTFVAPLGLIPFFSHGYLYDFTTIFLFTLSLGFMVRRRSLAYLLAFSLAVINKETALLLIGVFAVYFHWDRSLERSVYLRYIRVQFGLFVFIKFVLWVLFLNTPGGPVEIHLITHNLHLLRTYSQGTVATVFSILLVALLAVERRKATAPFLNAVLLMLIPALVLGLFFGHLDEWRDYYEFYPAVLLFLAQTVADVTGLNVKTVRLGETVPEPVAEAPDVAVRTAGPAIESANG
jgi:hypothetical protein